MHEGQRFMTKAYLTNEDTPKAQTGKLLPDGGAALDSSPLDADRHQLLQTKEEEAKVAYQSQ